MYKPNDLSQKEHNLVRLKQKLFHPNAFNKEEPSNE